MLLDLEKIKTIGVFVLVFSIGFIAGFNAANMKSYLNSNTKNTGVEINTKNKDMQIVKNTETESSNCIIKGNVNSNGKKIYHVQGGQYYKTVGAEECFNTEDEALTAGFTKSSR